MKHPWLFLDGFWWALVSFRLFFGGFWGFRWFAWHRWCPRFRWSPWLSFSLCVCWVFRGPPTPPPQTHPPFRLVVRYANHPVYAYANASAFSHASAYPNNAFAYSRALAYAYACPKVIIGLSRLCLPCQLFCKIETMSYCLHWNTVYHFYVF